MSDVGEATGLQPCPWNGAPPRVAGRLDSFLGQVFSESAFEFLFATCTAGDDGREEKA